MNKKKFVDKDTLRGLKKLDDWVHREAWLKNDVDIETAIQVREIISRIEAKGYYDTSEAGLLNYMRDEYYKHKNGK